VVGKTGESLVLNTIVRVGLLLVLAGPPMVHQADQRSVSGVVVDRRGNALPKAVVQIENEIFLTVKSYVTGNDGRYHFLALNPNIDYTLRAHYRKDWSKPKTLSRFNAASRPAIDLVIPIE